MTHQIPFVIVCFHNPFQKQIDLSCRKWEVSMSNSKTQATFWQPLLKHNMLVLRRLPRQASMVESWVPPLITVRVVKMGQSLHIQAIRGAVPPFLQGKTRSTSKSMITWQVADLCGWVRSERCRRDQMSTTIRLSLMKMLSKPRRNQTNACSVNHTINTKEYDYLLNHMV